MLFLHFVYKQNKIATTTITITKYKKWQTNEHKRQAQNIHTPPFNYTFCSRPDVPSPQPETTKKQTYRHKIPYPMLVTSICGVLFTHDVRGGLTHDELKFQRSDRNCNSGGSWKNDFRLEKETR